MSIPIVNNRQGRWSKPKHTHTVRWWVFDFWQIQRVSDGIFLPRLVRRGLRRKGPSMDGWHTLGSHVPITGRTLITNRTFVGRRGKHRVGLTGKVSGLYVWRILIVSRWNITGWITIRRMAIGLWKLLRKMRLKLTSGLSGLVMMRYYCFG